MIIASMSASKSLRVGLGVAATAVIAACTPSEDRYAGWTAYGGTAEQARYSSLNQINRANVQRLAVAWTFDTGETGAMQTQPIVIDGVLYGVTPTHKAFALDAATGARLWTFDSGTSGSGGNRGLAAWGGAGERRIFAAIDSFVYALDARTGVPIATFGTNGRIDLRDGVDRPRADVSIRLTTPGIIYRDLLIVGGRLSETLPAPPGDIRAFDVRTGALRWTDRKSVV